MCWSRRLLVTLLLSSFTFPVSHLHSAVPNPALTLAWDHDPGPYSYNVYESTDLLAGWFLWTNVTDLSVPIEPADGAHFFTVTCVDTNTGEESTFATK